MLKRRNSGYILGALALAFGLGAAACSTTQRAESGPSTIRSEEAPATSTSRSAAPAAKAEGKAMAPSDRESVASVAVEEASEGAGEAPTEDSLRDERAAPPPQRFPQAGQLTAGIWDDNLNLDLFLDYRSGLEQRGLDGLLPIAEGVHRTTSRSHVRQARSTIDISFVIDATGSMGDEIRYLQGEFLSLSREIEERYSGSEQRWSLVVYRDRGDEYVVREFDFDSSPSAFRKHLARQSAGGGGDYPEAAHEGLAAAMNEQWRTGPDTARLLFWVADAPHHSQKARSLARAIHSAHKKDVHIYPVASSGVDELTELTMRSAAQLTGGRYIFLTDDSGVGYSHKEPTIPCYHVTSLRDAILRSVSMEMSGRHLSPRQSEVLRTTGAPQQGRCGDQEQRAVDDWSWER